MNSYTEIAVNQQVRVPTLLECNECGALLRPGARLAHDAWHACVDPIISEGVDRLIDRLIEAARAEHHERGQ